jgi:hypothetical protein
LTTKLDWGTGEVITGLRDGLTQSKKERCTSRSAMLFFKRHSSQLSLLGIRKVTNFKYSNQREMKLELKGTSNTR